MASLFQPNQPAPSSPLQSDVIRDNFDSLYDKLKTLELRAQSPATTSLIVTGGPVYFRPGTSQQLSFLNFNTKVVNILTATSYKTKKNLDGTLYRELQLAAGPSNFQVEGLFLEVLISIQNNGQVVFTEALAGQNNQLSSPFNIYIADSEVPIAFVVLKKTVEGALLPIEQTDIREARAVVSPAFQNNPQVSEVEAQVEDQATRISSLEGGLQVTNNLLVKLPSVGKLIADNATTTNTIVEVLSGSAYLQDDGYLLRFAGARVDFKATPPSVGFPNTPRIISASIPSFVNGNYNKALIGVQYSGSYVDGENAELVVTHGTAAPAADQVVEPIIPADTIPLAFVLYRTTATDVYPLISTTSIGAIRISYEFIITDLISVPTSDPSDPAYITLEVDLSSESYTETYVTGTLFQVGDPVDIFDTNTRYLRRFVQNITYNVTTKKALVTVNNSFTEISLPRSPKIRSVSQHLNIIEDLRPFVGVR
jgi:hypothetical protein